MSIAHIKPLGHKSYPSIPHLAYSKKTKGDRGVVNDGQEFLATRCSSGGNTLVIITEKVDGAGVSIARIGNDIIPLQRSGHLATASPYEHLQMFAEWTKKNESRFLGVLDDGERICAEWIAMVHTIPYLVYKDQDPLIVFDIMRNGYDRATDLELSQRLHSKFRLAHHVSVGKSMTPRRAMTMLGELGESGAMDRPEGCVWRVERGPATLFLAKWVRPDFEPGKHLSQFSGKPPIWNWRG